MLPSACVVYFEFVECRPPRPIHIRVFKVILRINHQVGHTNSLTYHLYCGRAGRAGRGDKEEHCNGNSSKSKREGEREARLVV